MILIISNKWDITVDFVVRELKLRNHPFLRLNTEDLIKEKCSLSLNPLSIKVTKNGIDYDLTESTRVIWNRRPGKPYDDLPKAEKPSDAIEGYVDNQWYSWIEAFQLLQNVIWINHPHANGLTENKARQLQLAADIGFRIPDTLISNDPKAIRSFFEGHGNRIVAKALYSPLIEEPEQDYFIFSNLINSLPHDCDDELRAAPSIYQEAFLPKIDYRVTVIANKVFPVKIEPRADNYFLDWRTQKEGLCFNSIFLPSEIEQMCMNYVKQCNLVFGAIDLIQCKNDFIFLEINPNGEWGWLQKPHGIPIAESLCDVMITYDLQTKTSHVF